MGGQMARNLRPFAVAFALLALAGTSSALEEHNPLDKLEEAKACGDRTLEEGEKLNSLESVMSLRLKRDDVLKTAIGKNGLPPPKELTGANKTYIDLLAEALVPCSANAAHEPTVKPSLNSKMEACGKNSEDASLFQAGEAKRYGDDAVLAIRQNLLRLFQSGSIGGTTHLLVVRRIPKPDDVSPKYPLDKDYRPLSNRSEDDLMLLRYLYAEEGKEPFQVFCKERIFKKGTSTLKVTFDKSALPADLQSAYVAEPPAPNAGGLWSKIVGSTQKVKLGDSVEYTVPQSDARVKEFDDIAKISDSQPPVPDQVTWAGERSTSFQFVLAKSPGEFIKPSRAGAEFGTSLPRGKDDADLQNSGDLELTADAALGLHFRWSDDIKGKTSRKGGPEYKGSRIWAITPYASINQSTQKLTFYEPPTFEAQTKKFAYAKMATGLRVDFQNTLPPKPVRLNELVDPFSIQAAGLQRQGLGGGVYLEYIGDNHNIVSARRLGGYVSPPQSLFGSFFGAYYKKPFPMDSFMGARLLEPAPDAGPNERPFRVDDDFLSGWFLKWDVIGVVEDLDYSRLPRNFGPIPDMDEPEYACWPLKCENKVVSGAVYGADLSLSIERYNLLSLGKEDLFASFTAKLKSRREFDGGNSSDLWDLTLKLQDPTSEKSRYWQIKYVIGEDYVTNTEEDQLSFGLVFTN